MFKGVYVDSLKAINQCSNAIAVINGFTYNVKTKI